MLCSEVYSVFTLVCYIPRYVFSVYECVLLCIVAVRSDILRWIVKKKKLKTQCLSFVFDFDFFFVYDIRMHHCTSTVEYVIFSYVPLDRYILRIIFHEESHHIIIIYNNTLHRTAFVRLIGFISSRDIRADV